MTLGDDVQALKGVGEAVAKLFARLGVANIAQLIDDYPRTYDDYSSVSLISDLRPGPISIKAVIKQVTGRYVRRGMHITEAIASDASGSVRLVWFNQPYRAAAITASKEYFISGLFELSRQ